MVRVVAAALILSAIVALLVTVWLYRRMAAKRERWQCYTRHGPGFTEVSVAKVRPGVFGQHVGVRQVMGAVPVVDKDWSQRVFDYEVEAHVRAEQLNARGAR